MDYATARAQMTDGDCVVLGHNRFRSWYDFKVWMIKIFDTTPYTHIAMIKTFEKRVWVVESVKPFVRISTLSSMLDQGPFWWYHLDVPCHEIETDAVLADVNKRQYSEIRAIIGKLFGIKVGGSKFVSCAEWFMSMREKSGLNFTCKPTPDALVDALDRMDISRHLVTETPVVLPYSAAITQ